MQDFVHQPLGFLNMVSLKKSSKGGLLGINAGFKGSGYMVYSLYIASGLELGLQGLRLAVEGFCFKAVTH